jgi:hypothetical protein
MAHQHPAAKAQRVVPRMAAGGHCCVRDKVLDSSTREAGLFVTSHSARNLLLLGSGVLNQEMRRAGVGLVGGLREVGWSPTLSDLTNPQPI